MDYHTCILKLYALTLTGMKLGLNNIQALDALFGYPSRAFPVIHVGGSNGKGSVCTKIAAALRHSGKNVGLYTSPHISTFRERIQINGKMIAEEEVATLLTEIFCKLETTPIPVTFFEVTTLLCFLFFARSGLDMAVLEVGLGGRFDATNIASSSLSIITSISLEHTDLLGKELELIAKEKAGIIKQNIPVLVGPKADFSTIREQAREKNSPFYSIREQFDDFEMENRAIAKRALELLAIPELSVQSGLAAKPPCRFEEVKERVILDVAHNPDGFERLFRSLRLHDSEGPYTVVCGLSKNKDLASCLAVLKQHAFQIILTQANHERAASADSLAEILSALEFPKSRLSVMPAISSAVAAALQLNSKGTLLICGSFFIMAEARLALHIEEPTDFLHLVEK